jgi:hypothetical protein
MQHCVTIRTHWPQISDRINNVFLWTTRYHCEMMYVDEAAPEWTVLSLKRESTDNTFSAIVRDTCASRFGTPLEAVSHNSCKRSFHERKSFFQLGFGHLEARCREASAGGCGKLLDNDLVMARLYAATSPPLTRKRDCPSECGPECFYHRRHVPAKPVWNLGENRSWHGRIVISTVVTLNQRHAGRNFGVPSQSAIDNEA